MSRISLTDGSGAWFNTEAAVLFKEDTRWDGRNHISVPTGSQWDHQWLYHTKSGKWVLHEFSAHQGVADSYTQIDESDAIAWLIQNRRFDDDGMDELPAEVRQSVLDGISAAEI